MQSDSSAPGETVRADPAARRLIRALTLSNRFHFYLVTCGSYPTASAVLSVVRSDVAATRGTAGVFRLDPYEAHDDFTEPIALEDLSQRVVKKLISPPPEHLAHGTILVLDATRAPPMDDEAWQLVFMRMNEQRNLIKNRLAGELVLLVTPRLEELFARAAPDFWSIRSGDYLVGTLPPPEAAELERGKPVVAADSYLSSEQNATDAAQALMDRGNRWLRNNEEANAAAKAMAAFDTARALAEYRLSQEPDRAEWLTLLEKSLIGGARAHELIGDLAGAAAMDARAERVRLDKTRPERVAQLDRRAPSVSTGQPKRVFVSFAAHDEPLVAEFISYLALLKRANLIRAWDTRRLGPGSDWKATVDAEIRKADVILLMVSADYLASDYVEDVEIKTAMARHRAGEAVVVPILLRPCLWHLAPFRDLKALPEDGTPVSTWPDREAAWTEVADALKGILTGVDKRSRSSFLSTGANAPAPPTPSTEMARAAPAFGAVRDPRFIPRAGYRQDRRDDRAPMAGAETPLFSWIHLSDIHMGQRSAARGWDQEMVLDALARDTAKLARDGLVPAPRAIFVTGDIAFGGKPEQHEKAGYWLEKIAAAVGLGRAQIYLVPGNHDVDRAADKDPATRRLLGALRDGTDDLDEVLKDPNDRARLANRMSSYFDFARGFGSPAELHWSLTKDIDSFTLTLVGLNTALLAADSEDHGKLRLGNEQLARLRDTRDDELTLVLSHHPFTEGWLMDEKHACNWVELRADIHLCGHTHDAEGTVSRTAGGMGMVTVVAGASHHDEQRDGTPETHGYNWAGVFRDTNDKTVLRVWPRVWSKRKEFRLDVGQVPDGKLFAEFHLRRIRLPVRG